MTTRRAWLWCAAAGILAFVASWLFGRIPDLKPCGPSGGLGAIIAFEFVRSPAEVAALFGAEPCRSALVAAQRTGVLLDNLWFIPAYTTFLVLAARAGGTAWWRWIAGALIIAGLSDEIEGVLLWSILADLPGTPARIGALSVAVHLKFALLALGTAGIGWALSRAGGWRRFAGLAVAAAGLAALLELGTGNVAAMMTAFSIGWFALLAIAISSAWLPAASR